MSARDSRDAEIVSSLWEPFIFLSGAVLAALLYLFAFPNASRYVLIACLCLGILLLGWRVIREAIAGRAGVDVIAISAMLASAAFGQWTAGMIILIMLSGGEALEAYASRRARRHLERLINRMPTIAHRRNDYALHDISVDQVVVGDALIVKPGELIPVDGVITSGTSTVDESLLTGESMPSDKKIYDRLLGGSVNQSGLLEMRATTGAEGSQYRRMVALVREAEQNRAPIVRLADRYSLGFTVVTFGMAGAAWFVSGDPLRALAVLVVATPCPLILATPIAILSGMSRAAKRGIIMRSGGALERLARADAFVFDKTGTLTYSTPAIRRVVPHGISEQEALRLAASLDQGSTHVLARVLVAYATKKKIPLVFPDLFKETIGKGVEGIIDGKPYLFGRLSFLREHGIPLSAERIKENEARKSRGMRSVYLAGRHGIVGEIRFADLARPGLPQFFRALRATGVKKIFMLTGDKASVAKDIGKRIGLSSIIAECIPEDKVKHIRNLQSHPYTVVMVGDGVNDAPALASADVGIAMGSNGSGMAADAADIVITVDDVSRVNDAHRLSVKTMRIAKTGIFVGMGLSFALMIVASKGYLPPVYGAVAQECVDVIVILQALRLPDPARKKKTK